MVSQSDYYAKAQRLIDHSGSEAAELAYRMMRRSLEEEDLPQAGEWLAIGQVVECLQNLPPGGEAALMKPLYRDAVWVLCLAGLAVLQFGWLVYPALGTAMNMLNVAFVLTCVAGYFTTQAGRRRTALLKLITTAWRRFNKWLEDSVHKYGNNDATDDSGLC